MFLEKHSSGTQPEPRRGEMITHFFQLREVGKPELQWGIFQNFPLRRGTEGDVASAIIQYLLLS